MTTTTKAWALVAVAMVAGCSAEGPYDWCSGAWRSDGGRIVLPSMTDYGACEFGNRLLWPDQTVTWSRPMIAVPGAAPVERAEPMWGFSGEDELAICDGDCTFYVQIARGTPARSEESGDGGGECTGSPTSCSSGSAGSCSVIDGCYLDIGSVYDSYDDACVGSAYSCSGYTSERSCRRQGCTWRE